MGGTTVGDDREESQMVFHARNFGVDRERETQVLDQVARELVDTGATVIPHAAQPTVI